MRSLGVVLFATMLIIISGCSSPSPTPASTQMEIIASPTNLHLGTSTPASNSETVPTKIPIKPTLSPTPTLRPDLSEEGPWLVYMGSGGLMGMNQDGSGLTVLVEESDDYGILLGPGSPSSGYSLVRLGDTWNFLSDLTLYLMHMPMGEIEEISSLLPLGLSQEILDRETEEIHAVVMSQPAWSPSGEHIAFVAVIEGPSSDLYIYDLEQKEITRLTSGSNQAIYPYWTLDGSAIIHLEAENLISMSEEHPRRIRAVWVVDIDSTRISKLLELPPGGEENPWTQTRLAGWTEDGDLLIYQNYYDLELDTLQEQYLIIDLAEGLKSVIGTESISGSSEIDQLKELIFRPRVGDDISSPDQKWQGTIGPEGIKLVHSETESSIIVYEVGIDVFIWKPDSSGFFIASDHSLYMANFPDGVLNLVDSFVGDFEDYFSWVGYDLDHELN